MKKIILISILTIIPNFVLAQSVVNKIVAKVDSTVITQADLKQAQKDFENALAQIKDPAEREQKRRENSGKTLQNLINEKLLDSEFAQAKIDVTTEEVQEAIQGLAYKQKKTMNQFEESLHNEGVSSQQVQSNMREDLRKNKFLQQVIFPRVRISDVDLQEYFNKHQNEFSTFSQIRFFQILLTPDSVQPGENLTKVAQNAANQLKKGGDFKTMAQRYSSGPFAAQGGDSGVLETSAMRADLSNFLLRLPLNTVSEPIAAGGGFFIFKVVQKSSPKTMSFNEAKNEVRQKLFEARVKEELERYIAEVRAKHYVEIVTN